MLGECRECHALLREIDRNDFFVFYQCECHTHKGVDWDRKTLFHEGEEYSLGSAGSLILECQREDCGEQHFRSPEYFYKPDIHRCFVHSESLMIPVKAADLQSYWYPKWERLGLRIPTPERQPE